MDNYKKSKFYIFLNNFLSRFLPQEHVKKLLVYEGYKEFEQAFTHPSFNPNFHYEKLEMLGDACIKPAFILYIFRNYPEIKNEGEISILTNYFLSKPFFSKISEDCGFPSHILISQDSKITIDMKEDVFESFVGALQQTGDRLINDYVGQMLVRKFIFMIFDENKIDTANLDRYRSYIQLLKEKHFDKFKTEDPKKAEMKWNAEKIGFKFKVEVLFDNKVIGVGYDNDKNKAKSNAAKDALEKLGLI